EQRSADCKSAVRQIKNLRYAEQIHIARPTVGQNPVYQRPFCTGTRRESEEIMKVAISLLNPVRLARRTRRILLLSALGSGLFSMVGLGGEAGPARYYHDLVPIFKRSCTGCHHPAKLKGELDLTTYAGSQRGGKHAPWFHPPEPE